jgi:putative transposase
MARQSRIVVPDLPHHVAQRGNRRQPLFVEPGDYALYRDLMAERCRANAVACWAYCLMPNHVHLILVPASADGLAKAVGEAHRRFTAFANARARVTGHLFQGRFSSRAMDEDHLVAAARYLALNPVRAGLVDNAADWRASSVPAHLAGRDDALATVAPLLNRIPRFADLFEPWPEEAAARAWFEAGAAAGRPLGDDGFLALVEAKLRRRVRPAKRGRKPRAGAADALGN